MSIPSIIVDDEQLRTLAMAVARNRVGPNDPIEEVLAAHTTSPKDFLRIVDDPVFKTYVQGFVREFSENGVSFAAKCRVLAEDAIQDMYLMVSDPEIPASARVKAVENLVDWAGLAPKQTLGADASRPTFSISINLPSAVSSQPIIIHGSELPPAPLPSPDADYSIDVDATEEAYAYEYQQ